MQDVTIITAVWSQQRDRDELLRGHFANLARCGQDATAVYVFDGGVSPPDWLHARTIVSSEPLTIYEAWNLALAAVRTPLVMNLNLDDRLAPDAVAVLKDALLRDPEAYLAGGDWLVCETAEAADATVPCHPASAVPFHPEWPPIAGRVTRLGSGDGRRGTYGPACLWRMAAHVRYPRYPYRFADGSRIRVVGDAVWWQMLTRGLGKRALRVPSIVGHYRTWPESQAEFRHSASEEHRRSDVSLL